MNGTQQEIDLFPMARASDPATSHIAAAQHKEKLSERRAQVLMLVEWFPGRTSGELSRKMLERFPGLPMRTCAETPHKRLPELEKMGMVIRGTPRDCADSGHLCETWWPK